MEWGEEEREREWKKERSGSLIAVRHEKQHSRSR